MVPYLVLTCARYLQGDDIEFNPSPIINALNLVTSSYAARTATPFGKNRYFYPSSSFDPPDPVLPLSTGVEAWKGFFTSVRPVFKQLMVNVNACMSAFYVPNSRLSDAIQTFKSASFGAEPNEFYRGIRVTTSYLGYRRRRSIEGFGKTARRTVFHCDEFGGDISIEEYFRKSEFPSR